MKLRNLNTRHQTCGTRTRERTATGRLPVWRTKEKNLGPITGASLDWLETKLKSINTKGKV